MFGASGLLVVPVQECRKFAYCLADVPTTNTNSEPVALVLLAMIVGRMYPMLAKTVSICCPLRIHLRERCRILTNQRHG